MSTITKPVRFPNGLSTDNVQNFFGSIGMPSPFKYHDYKNDFDTYLAGDWTVTEVGVNTQALTDADGGALLLTNAAADNDATTMIKLGESFAFETGKKLWFSAKFQVSDATDSDIFMGLAIKTATAPVTTPPTDGVFFRKDDGDANVDVVVTKDSTATTSTAATTMADATDITLSFYYDGVDNIQAWSGDTIIANTIATTNLPDDEVLSPFIHLQNGEAVAKTMTIDYIFAAKER